MNHIVKPLVLLFLFAILSVQQVQAANNSGAAKPKEVPLSGKVLETMDGGGYTYINLQNGADKVWVAIPLMKVSVGQQLTLMPGFAMQNFNSKALNRKFDKVIFSGGISSAETVQLSPAAIKMVHKNVPNATQNQAAAKEQPKATQPKPKSSKPAKNTRVDKAKGAGAYNIAEIHAQKKKLEKKQVVVRGRVTKVAERIMKRNWVHIQDGSGSKGKKTDELVVTSKQLPKEGDVVTVTGTLYNNLDFGSGYRYNVLIQDARLK